jgi:hypothetical protein
VPIQIIPVRFADRFTSIQRPRSDQDFFFGTFAAEILGEDEQLLWGLADDMDPEDGRLWIYGTDDQQTIAFTPAGMEYLRELLAEHKRNRTSPRS